MHKLSTTINIILLVILLTGCATTVPRTPLIEATHHNDSSQIEELLNDGSDINAFGGYYGETPLMVASREGNFNIVKLLVVKGANINAGGAYGDTALTASAWTCQYEIMQYLVANGADINIKNSGYGSTALNIAAGKCKDTRIVHLLLDSGADIQTINKQGDSPLFSAIKDGNLDTVDALIQAGSNIDEQNKNGYSALMIAVLNSHKEIVNLLIDKGANLETRNSFGDTALALAKNYKHTDIEQLLMKAGASKPPEKSGFRRIYLPTHQFRK